MRCIVTLDADFADLSLLRGQPPKVIWLRCGNSTVAEEDPDASYLEVWP